MLGQSRRSSVRRRFLSRETSKTSYRALRAEWLETRAMLSGNTAASLVIGGYPAVGAASVHAAVDAPPTVAQQISLVGSSAITGKTASFSVLGADDGGESHLTHTWSVTAEPGGSTASFSDNGTNTAKNVTATFTKAGTYSFKVTIVDAGGLSVTTTNSAVVLPTLTSISITTPSGVVIAAGSTLAVSGTSQSITAQGLDQFGNLLATQPTFTWSFNSLPSGVAAPGLQTRGGVATVTFSKSGAYGLGITATSGTTSISRTVTMSVGQVVSGVKNASTALLYGYGRTVQVALPTFVDQFGNVMSTPALTWSTLSGPANVAAPTFSTSGSTTTITFNAYGSYYFSAHVTSNANVSFTTSVYVYQTLSTIALAPNTASVLQGTTQQFTPLALDQFGQAMANQQTFSWSASAGTVSSSGLYTAPANGSSATVTAKSGTVAGTATVTLLANSTALQDPALAKLVTSLDADGSLSRNDMIQILRSVAANGALSATDFSDLKKIVSQAAKYNMPSYVQALVSDVVNGNAANATYLGQSLGNLAVGSSSTQLTDLIGKWFLGSDLPTLCDSSLVYHSVAGSLFPRAPSHADEDQGELGDCYLISALGTLADSNPAAIENMIINNGDGTDTVRFYTGTYGTTGYTSDGGIGAGFTANSVITADYVTVNSMLPTNSAGQLVYADYGASYTNAANSLWIPLIEKAYAQWNQTGKEGRDNTNAYSSIQGGWMATVDAQVLGHNATDYIMTNTSAQIAVNALASHEAVTIGTGSWSGTYLGLYSSHAYAIVGYNATNKTFTLYNPWGIDQPGQLTWAQLQSATTQMAVANTTGSVPISGAVTSPVGKVSMALFAGRVSDLLPGISPTTSMPASLPALMAAHSRLPSAAASQGVFTMLASRQEALEKLRLAQAGPGTLSASSVDATFTIDGLSLPDDALAALV